MLQQLALAGVVLFAIVALASDCRGNTIGLHFPQLTPLVVFLRVEGSGMYRVCYWAMIADRESDGRFVASTPGSLGPRRPTATPPRTRLLTSPVRAAMGDGQQVPPRRQCCEMPSQIRRSKNVGRAIIPVEVGRWEAWPTPPCHMSR